MAEEQSLLVRLAALEDRVENQRNNREQVPRWRQWQFREIAYSAGARILLVISLLLSITFMSMWNIHTRIQKLESRDSACLVLGQHTSRGASAQLLKGRSKERAFLEAAGEGNLMEVLALIQSGLIIHPDVARDPTHGSTALHLAARAGHHEVCQALVDAGANVDETNKWHNTPLHSAAGSGHLQTVQLLIDRGASLLSRGYFNDTPWERATTHGHSTVAEWIHHKQISVK